MNFSKGAVNLGKGSLAGKVLRQLLASQRDLGPLLRGGAPDEDVARFLADSMWTKQAGHGIGDSDFAQPARGMSAIGG